MTDTVVVLSESLSTIDVVEENVVIEVVEDSVEITLESESDTIVVDDGHVDVVTALEQGPPGATSSYPDIDSGTVLARRTAGTGAPEELTPSEVLDLIGATPHALLVRTGSGWTILPPGGSGQLLQAHGASADPTWSTVAGTGTSSESVVVEKNNGDSVSLLFGLAVYGLGDDWVRAQANDASTRNVVGLVSDTIVSVGGDTHVMLFGVLEGTTTQWDYVTGQSGGLTPNAPYFLSTSTPGKLMSPGPVPITGEDLWSVQVGIALNSTQMKIDVQQSVKL